jgi:hypothetical protein
LEFNKLWRCTKPSHRLKCVMAITKEQHAKFSLTDAHCILQHGVEHRLKLAWRTADDLQHLGTRSLLRQRLVALVPKPNELFFKVSSGYALRSRLTRLLPRRLMTSAFDRLASYSVAPFHLTPGVPTMRYPG